MFVKTQIHMHTKSKRTKISTARYSCEERWKGETQGRVEEKRIEKRRVVVKEAKKGPGEKRWTGLERKKRRDKIEETLAKAREKKNGQNKKVSKWRGNDGHLNHNEEH